MKNSLYNVADKNTLYRMSSLFTTRHILGFKPEFLYGGWSQLESLNIKEIYENYYKILQGNYRCEYVYKNEIVNQILLKNHKGNAKLYTELDIHDSKADVVIMNGTSTVYEIKTELDNFDRLEKQLASYRLVFDKIYVVTHESKLKALKKLIGKDIGIVILNNNNVLETKRSARSNKANVEPEYIFNLLRREEYIGIVKECFGKTPNVPPVHIFTECKKLFRKLDPLIAHDKMVNAIRNRSESNHRKNLFASLPVSLKLLGLSGKLTRSECELLLQNLEKNSKAMCA